MLAYTGGSLRLGTHSCAGISGHGPGEGGVWEQGCVAVLLGCTLTVGFLHPCSGVSAISAETQPHKSVGSEWLLLHGLGLPCSRGCLGQH